MGWVLAVDFGTSNTSAAHRIGPDRVESLPLSHTSNLMSSSVYVDGPQAITTGDLAINQALIDPSGFIVAPKSQVGAGTVLVRRQEVPVATTIAAVLRTVYNQALPRHNNHPPSDVILTHPEAWSPHEIAVLREAASLAGLGGRVSLISEPRAAAFYYSRQHDAKIVKGSTIAVFDFGGGTLDVAVLTATDEWTFEVVHAGGDNSLGGKDLDATITGRVEQHLRDDDPQLLAWLRTPEGLEARRNLDDQVRRAKELLSEHPSATIRVTGNGSDRTVTLTRDEFEQLIEPQITRGVQLAAHVLRAAGVDRKDLQALYLTGGSSRIPYVHRRLSELAPIATLDDPKTVVAKGAAGFVAGGRATVPPAEVDTAVLPRKRNPQPTTTTTATTFRAHRSRDRKAGGRRRLRTPWLMAGAALAAIAMSAGVVTALTRQSTAPAAAAAADQHAEAADETGGLPAATTDSNYRSETTEDVTALLPKKLILSSSSCERSGFSFDGGALEVRCNIDPDSTVGKAIEMDSYDHTSVRASRDDQSARSTFIRLRDSTSATRTTVVSDDYNRLVDRDETNVHSVAYTLIDRSTGLIASFSVDRTDIGSTLLTEIGWDI